jgi:N-acetylglucosaminyl-diphospho-decaprenol L-rhamnosyltransferase
MSVGAGDPGITAVVVLYNSSAVIEDCLRSLLLAAPRRGVRAVIVDNASADDGAARAAAQLGDGAVLRLPVNRGFAAGVNAGLAAAETPWLAVVNPDLRFAPGALDQLADALEARPRVALVGPLVRDSTGEREDTAGVFPSPDRERAHAWMLDRLLGWPGRHCAQPDEAARVDWVSGCAWLLRREAWRACGPLDETYFMFLEDVDYCRRLGEAGWECQLIPAANARHDRGTGSTDSGFLPADGGRALLRYLVKFYPRTSPVALRKVLASGWRLRLALHTLRGALGDARSAGLARRYARALASLAEATN